MLSMKKDAKIEQLASEVLDKIEDLIVFTDKALRPIDANETFLKKFGFEDIKQFYQYHRSLRELLFWEKHNYLNDSEWKTYLIHNKNYHVKIKDTKSVKDYHINVYKAQKKEGYFVIFTDVTDIYRSAQVAKEFENLKSGFLANISHEFRTPMNGILGFLELFYYTDLSDKQKEYLSMISRSSKVLMSNIEALLDYSQLQSGKLALNNKYENLIDIVEKVVKNHIPAVFEGKKHFYTFIDPTIPQEVLIDSRKIRQILNALIDNAIKFTNKYGSIIVEVKLLKKDITGECDILFSVRDNGIGIDTQKIEKLLEPFSSHGTADKRLGIGLSLASGLVTLFGSKLEIKSKLSKGSDFSFVLHTKGSSTPSFQAENTKRVYIFELDPKLRNYANTLALYMQSFGYKIAKVSDVKQEYINNCDISIVVASNDIQLEPLITIQNSKPMFLFLDRQNNVSKKTKKEFETIIQEPLLPSRLFSSIVEGIDLHIFTHTQTKQEPNKQLRVLVVEDNIINQKLLKTILEEKKIEVDIAGDGIEAVEMANKKEYDIIFMDIDLPGKNGIEATQEIKESSKFNKTTPVIAQTAMALDGDKEKLLAKGLDGYIPKPLKKDALLLLIDTFSVN